MSQAWIDNSLDELEALLERLFSLCDRFLEGDTQAELEPLKKDVARRLARLQSEMRVEGVGDTASGDRLRAIAERFDNLKRYWGRLSERMKSSPRPTPSDPVEDGRDLRYRASLEPPGIPTPPLGTPAVHASSHAPPPVERSSLTPDRVRQIQRELAALDPESAELSIERLSKLLRETEASLRARYGDRVISFRVLMRGKKPVIKPIVR